MKLAITTIYGKPNQTKRKSKIFNKIYTYILTVQKREEQKEILY